MTSVLFLPGTYIPRKEVSVQELIRASVIKKNQALKLRAVKEMKDQEGNFRVTGKKKNCYLLQFRAAFQVFKCCELE